MHISHKTANLLGIEIAGTTKDRVLVQVQDFVDNHASRSKKSACKLIVTPNPEIVLLTHIDKDYRYIINKSDLMIPDGIGLAVAKKLSEVKLPSKLLTVTARLLYLPFLYAAVLVSKDWLTDDFEIIHGRKIFLDIVKLAQQKKYKVFLYGARGTVVSEAVIQLKKQFNGLQIKGMAAPEYTNTALPRSADAKKIDQYALQQITAFKPDILFVGIEPPKQEKWIWKNRDLLNTKVAIAVGGTFDYVVGNVPTPPKIMERYELEWFWRLLTQPKRIKRIIRASIIFPLTVVFN